MKKKTLLPIILGILLISLVSAIPFAYDYLEHPTEGITTGANYSINVNNSNYLQGYTPTTLGNWLQSTFNWITNSVSTLTNYYSKTDINNFNASYLNMTNTSYVPYTGANQNVNLGNYNLTVNSIIFTTAGSTGGWTEYLNSFSGNQNYTINNLNSFIFLNKTTTNFTLYDNTLLLLMNLDNRSTLGENDTIVKDLSLNGNNGVVFGGANTTWSNTGKYNGAFNFTNESNSYIQISSLSWITKSYWSNIYGVWKNIVVNSDNTYVNGVLKCPSGMAYINKLGGYCIDKYEASTPGCEIVMKNCANYTHASYCPTACTPTSGSFGTTGSGAGTTAIAYSKQNVAPLVGISQYQAREMCANAGKHLCTSEEWLGAADINGVYYNLPPDLGVSPNFCNTISTTNCNYSYIANTSLNYACNTSQYVSGLSNCSSSGGVYDITGNVWEWTNETVSYTQPLGAGWRYWNGTAWLTTTNAQTAKYGNDGVYFLATGSGNAVLRGGYWGNAGRAGPFCAYLVYAPSYVTRDIGFRCCSS